MWTLSDKTLSSRLILGAQSYASSEVLAETLAAAGAELVSVPLRGGPGGPASGLPGLQALIEELGIQLLPSTRMSRNAKDAVSAAYQARDLLGQGWLQLEIVGDEQSGLPDTAATIEVAGKLIKQGFDVMPVTTEDVVAARHLVELGCNTLILRGHAAGPHGGLAQIFALRPLRERFPETTLIVDAAVRRPSEAALALELGFDGVLVDDAVACARDPISMAEAFADAAVAGRMGFEAGLREENAAAARDPLVSTPFWHTLPE